jgi:aminoglycoside/choline kinase family phosphotransferase
MRRPLLADPAYDGMELAPALAQLWGEPPADASLEKLPGHLSTRSYYRLHSAQREPGSLVVMRLAAGGTPRELGLAELPFVNVQRYLAGLDLPVPKIWVDDSEHGLLLLEDLGDETFEARLARTPRERWQELYGRAVDLLAELHERAAEPGDCIAYARGFDRKLLRWELEHFRDWGLAALDITLAADEAALLERSFDALLDELLALPQGFAHRDYQSRNLMWARADALVLIDFQDALLGPLGYDLAALLCDSYVALDQPLQRSMIERYARARGLAAHELERAFWLVSLQRKLKDAGRFVFADQVRGIPDFLPWYGPSLRYVARALAQLPQYAPLAALLTRKIANFAHGAATPPARTGQRREG